MTHLKGRSVSKRAVRRAISKRGVKTTEERAIQKAISSTGYAEDVGNVITDMERSSTEETAQHSENAAKAVE